VFELQTGQSMRITFVCPPVNLSGGIRVIATYAHRLHLRGHQVVVVAPPPRQPSLRDKVRSLVKHGTFPAAEVADASHFDGLGLDLRVLDRHRPVSAGDVPDADVVIATWWETAEWVWALPPSKGVKVHFMQDYEVFPGMDVARVDATCALPIPKIVIAEWVREVLETKFGQSPLRVVRNSVDTELFHAPPRKKNATPTVGVNYQTMFSKGCDICLRAVELAREQIPELKLIAFASVPETEQLPLPAGTEFHLKVPNEKLREIYAACDGWLFGTRREGFGLPLLEAMACRTPVIAAPGGAAPELLAMGGGILVPPEDPAAMAQAIVDLAGWSDEKWTAVSDAAYTTATRYTWEDATDLFEQSLIEARARR
jgi:glycosyltransferase involved in cell wall biosynthesis